MTCAEFANEVIAVCAEEQELVTECVLILYDEPVVKFRVVLIDDSFIDVFYNAETQKLSFAQIAGDQRFFGADNTRGWHIHPLDDPASHRPHPPMRFGEFLAAVKRQIR